MLANSSGVTLKLRSFNGLRWRRPPRLPPAVQAEVGCPQAQPVVDWELPDGAGLGQLIANNIQGTVNCLVWPRVTRVG
jgi:hypothetical protein